MLNEVFNSRLRFYQSANAEGSEIANDFVIRIEEYNTIIEDIRRNPMKGSVQHFLLLGRRGSGKSTILRRLQHEIETDKKLHKDYLVINPAEEQANIYRLFDLWEEVIQELKCKNIAIEETEWKDDVQEYSRNLFQNIHKALQQSGKKLIILLDNVDRIFENLKDDANLLREFLLNFDDIRIIGGSTRMSEHFWRYDLPFYEFFRRINLEGLNSDEIKKLLLHWSQKLDLPQLKEFVETRPGQLETIRLLTDGLPRTLQFFVNILLNQTDLNGYQYLKQIMDGVSPLYQERLNNLPAAHRKIVLQLAFFWEAVGVKEISAACRIESKLVSAHLKQLADNGVVDKIGTNKKNHLYRLSERFFNMWLIMTQGSPNEKRKAKWLTIFLENWYAADDIKKIAYSHIEALDKKSLNSNHAAFISKALAQSKYISLSDRDILIGKTLQLEGLNDELKKQLPLTFGKVLEKVFNLIDKKNFKEALEILRNVEQNDVFIDSLLGRIYEISIDYVNAEKHYLKAIEGGVKSVFLNLGSVYGDMKKYDLAEKYFLLALENNDEDALFNLGLIYDNQQKDELAERYYLLSINKKNVDALNNLAGLYYKQGKYDLTEKYSLQFLDNNIEDEEALQNFAVLYYDGFKKDKKIALEFIEKSYQIKKSKNQNVRIVIKAWNGIFKDLRNDLVDLLNDKDVELMPMTLTDLLVHFQTKIVQSLFKDEIYGVDLQNKFAPIYYATEILTNENKEDIELKIPPEIKETVESILTTVKERRKEYYGGE